MLQGTLLAEAIMEQNKATKKFVMLQKSLIGEIAATAVPPDARSSCCVVVTIDDIKRIRSWDPDDYRPNQKRLLKDAIMGCKSSTELLSTISKILRTGRIGPVELGSELRDVLAAYTSVTPAIPKNQNCKSN